MYDKDTILHFDNKVFRICFAGVISCIKEGFDILFEALQKVNSVKNVQLYLYGPLHENDKNALEKLVTAFNLSDKVFYVGNIDPDELLKEFVKYHLLILPRPLNLQTKYGFSTKLSEYLVSGVPVLVTDVSDNTLYIKDKINGYVVSPGSPLKMADKIIEIMDSYNANAADVAKNAKLTAAGEFDYKLFTRTFSDFFFKD
jgi:glycosyltransferase involved in cell wall biosynthesis